MIISKRRLYYEKELEKNSLNYDLWFDYTKLEEDFGDVSSCREVYERAISNIPPIKEKKYWRRYQTRRTICIEIGISNSK